jgi:outer membrane protein assembly factor BamD
MRLRKSQVGTESMLRRTIAVAVVTLTLFFLSLGSSQAQTPNTNARAEQSDKILLERAMKAINKSQYGAARSLLETLINNYPDSAFVSPAKLSIGDAWYAEGSYKQAELEYRDFVTFFPNRPEASAARRKIDSIQRKAKL